MAKALGHPARLAILRTLAERACVCGEIVDLLPLARSTVSQHLKVLKDAGWITGAIDGPPTCDALNRDAIEALRFVLGPMLEQWEGASRCPVGSRRGAASPRETPTHPNTPAPVMAAACPGSAPAA
jgi:ArsR family transcriptional regulator, arsenate/arsenite/antimonite-responsive transcriptional repressor